MFRSTMIEKNVIKVTDPKSPKEQHLIFPSGWAGQYHVISESAVHSVPQVTHELMMLREIQSNFGTTTYTKVKSTLRTGGQ
jgi:hypothetical protein